MKNGIVQRMLAAKADNDAKAVKHLWNQAQSYRWISGKTLRKLKRIMKED